MAHFSQEDALIACTCGSLRPLTKLYFCRHCVVLRCGYCISHEVDSIYCSNCLENLASSEAKLKKNRCGACFSCPCCFHILTIRASTVSRIVAPTAEGSPATSRTPTKSEGSPATSKTSVKSYYLSCFFCRWTTRDARIPDQPTSTSSNWPEHITEYAPRIASLIEYYKMITFREKMEKENRLFLHTTSSRRNYQHFSEKFGLSAMLARKRAGLPPLNLGRDDAIAQPQVTSAQASEEVDALPEDIFTKPVDLVQVTSLPQRFVIPDFQPEAMSDLFPVHKQLSVKRSLRCKACLHNIFKPEYGPASIKFKIHMAAYFYVPEIRLMKKVKLKKGEGTELILKIINPAQIATNIQFLQLTDVPVELAAPVVKVEEKESIPGLVPVQKKEYPLEKPRTVTFPTNGAIDLPGVTITLPARDDTAEYDDVNDSNQYQDDPAIVVWRKGNKVQVRFVVTVDDGVEIGGEVKVGFGIRFTYHDKIISPLEQKESKNVSIDMRHYLNVGFLE